MKYPFYEALLVLYKDIERCPYTPKDPKSVQWFRDDDRRLLLIALDRYTEYLNKRYPEYEQSVERARRKGYPYAFR